MNEWISARDRTPEPGKTALCYYQYEISGMKHFNFMFGCYVEGEGWHRVCTTGYRYDSYIEPLDVLHWIELPGLPYDELKPDDYCSRAKRRENINGDKNN